jgi:hypothetical protein
VRRHWVLFSPSGPKVHKVDASLRVLLLFCHGNAKNTDRLLFPCDRQRRLSMALSLCRVFTTSTMYPWSIRNVTIAHHSFSSRRGYQKTLRKMNTARNFPLIKQQSPTHKFTKQTVHCFTSPHSRLINCI